MSMFSKQHSVHEGLFFFKVLQDEHPGRLIRQIIGQEGGH